VGKQVRPNAQTDAQNREVMEQWKTILPDGHASGHVQVLDKCLLQPCIDLFLAFRPDEIQTRDQENAESDKREPRHAGEA